MEKKKNYHAVSCSCGKDSTAMLLLMIEKDMPIDAVLTADTGMEFPEMYDHMAKVDTYLYRERGIHLTMLKSSNSFEYLMFEQPKSAGKTWVSRPMGTDGRGFGFAGVPGSLRPI